MSPVSHVAHEGTDSLDLDTNYPPPPPPTNRWLEAPLGGFLGEATGGGLGGNLNSVLDLGADLKARRLLGVEHDGVPNNSRRTMPNYALPGPRRAFPT